MNSLKKLYDMEVAPPAEAWNRIALELDEINEFRTVSQKLQNVEVAAPPLSWNNIRSEMDDQQSFETIANKLRNAAVAPPSKAWQNIENALDNAKPAIGKVLPMNTAIKKWAKYAAAACIIGIVGFFVYRMKDTTSKDFDAIASGLQKTEQQNSEVLPQATPTEKNNTQQIAQQENPKSYASARPANIPTHVQTVNGNNYSTTIEKNKEIDGRYIILMTQDGEVVRMARKLGNMADCIAGEDESNDCNLQIAAWQKEIATSPVSSTPADFLDLLELANKETVMY